jgi:hypothetical protein
MVIARRRASAFGLFTSVCGVAAFAGSALAGLVHDVSSIAAAVFCLAVELAAVPFLPMTARSLPWDGAERRAPPSEHRGEAAQARTRSILPASRMHIRVISHSSQIKSDPPVRSEAVQVEPSVVRAPEAVGLRRAQVELHAFTM